MALEKLTCQNCGSNDFRREGEYYICNHCETKYIRPDNNDNDTYQINININFDEDPKPLNIQVEPGTDSPEDPVPLDIPVEPAEDFPDEKKNRKSCLGCLLAFAVSILAILILAVSTGEKRVSDSSFQRDSQMTDMALLQKEGHPRLFSSRQSVLDFYAGYGNLVKLDKEYNSDTILHIETQEQNRAKAASGASSGNSSSQKQITDIQIDFSHMKNKPALSLEEAVQLANSFMPWDLIDTYYQLSEAVSYKESDAADAGMRYLVLYGLQKKYTMNYAKQDMGLSGSIGFRIYTNQSGEIEYMRVEVLPRIQGRMYDKKPWQSPALRQVPVDESWKQVGWQIVTESEPPTLLGDYQAMLEFGKKIPVEAVNISCEKESAISYGLNEQGQFFTVDGREHKDKSRYVFEIQFNFTKLLPERKVTLSEAVAVMKNFMPYDLLARYYTLNFSRKISPTNRNIDGSMEYQVVYDRVMTDANRAEINKLELPENIKAIVKTDADGYALNASVNCYRHTRGVKGRSYELLKDSRGEIREIYSPGRELGPYESGDDFHYIEPWENPF